MHNKKSLFRIAAAVFAGVILGGILFHAPLHSDAWAAEDLFDELAGDNSASITAIPLQLGRDTYGLAMVDKENQTLWIYEIASRKPGFSQLRLMAARSWQYDRKLTEFNSGEPSPRYIKNFLEGKKTAGTSEENAALKTETPETN